MDSRWVVQKDESGHQMGIMGLNRDITVRRKLEEERQIALRRFYLILSSMHFGILLVTDDNKVEFANQAFCDNFGLKDSPNDLLKLSADEIIEKIRFSYADPDAEVAHIRELVSLGQSVHGEVVDMSGGRTFLRDFIPMWINEKRFGRLWVHADITERTRIEVALEETNALLQARNAELDSFNYSVSHDLRGPLRAIGAFSTMLAKEYAAKMDDEEKVYLKQITRSVDRMAQIIDDLLKLSRITRVEIKRADVDLGDIVKTLARELKHNAPERVVEFAVDDIIVHADAGLMRIVMENLIFNAWKFTSRRPQARIEFSSRQEGEKTIYFVRDNGEGFDMAHSRKLFTPFQRLHSESEFPGTGIGLAIIRRIIEHHGGKVWAEGEVGKGATIYFEVPAELDIKETGGGGIDG